MEEHYIKDVGKITYVYGVNLEEHKTVIEKQQKRIAELEQELAEKDKEIAHLKEKDNYHLRYELAGADETITNLKKQLAEKDKEIEKLKQQYTILENENGKLTTELIMDKYKKAQKEVSFGKQLAIQELVEVERLLYESHYKEIDGKYYAEYEDINNLIDNRIKALEGLKGEQT